jgi:hypothetical protein
MAEAPQRPGEVRRNGGRTEPCTSRSEAKSTRGRYAVLLIGRGLTLAKGDSPLFQIRPGPGEGSHALVSDSSRPWRREPRPCFRFVPALEKGATPLFQIRTGLGGGDLGRGGRVRGEVIRRLRGELIRRVRGPPSGPSAHNQSLCA